MRRGAPCHGVLTARMTPTAQAGWKSWYVSAPIVTFYDRLIATQTSTDSYVCATPSQQRQKLEDVLRLLGDLLDSENC